MMIFKGRNRVTSGFRLAARPSHNGIDLVGDDDKTVHAVAGGTVGFAGAVSKSAGYGRSGMAILNTLWKVRQYSFFIGFMCGNLSFYLFCILRWC